MNHFARMCRSSGKKSSAIQNVTQESNTSEQDMPPVYVQHVGNSGKFKLCNVNIDGHSTTLLVDVGAKVSILNDKVYRQHFSHHKLEPQIEPLKAYENSTIPAIGMVYVTVNYDNMTLEKFPFYVSTRCKSHGC